MLALAQPGEAEIIYTPTNVGIGPSGTYSLDLTGDGTTDFMFLASWHTSTSVFWGGLFVGPAQAGNAIADDAAALRAGYLIGPDTKWSSQSLMEMARGHHSSSPWRSTCGGPWKDKRNRYLGLKFMISGEIHYGWARLTETCGKGKYSRYGGENSAVLTGYAYETVPNQGLKAGQKKEKKEELEDESLTRPGEATPLSVLAPTAATLGMLAKGAQALSIWRRE
jgi:hypothetical protein